MTDEPSSNRPEQQPLRPRSRGRSSTAAAIGELLRALGDEQHPDHLTAVAALVRIGRSVVPEVARTVSVKRPWLAVYNALEVLAELRDGRGCTAMLRALRHPNANVRWMAVRGLARLPDPRAWWALQRAARRDEGRTSWGESVKAAAQAELDTLQRRPLMYWGREVILTLLALAAVFWAFSLFQGLLQDVESELQVFGRQDVGIEVPTLTLPTVTPRPTLVPTVTPIATVVAQPTSSAVQGVAAQTANVRPLPATDNQPIGQIVGGDRVIVLGRTADGQWLQIRLSETAAALSRIDTADGNGWISRSLVTIAEDAYTTLLVVTP